MQFFSRCEEKVELLPGNIDHSVIHEDEDRLQVTEIHPLEVEERVLVKVLLQHSVYERRAGGQDALVCSDLSLTTAQSDVKKVLFLSDRSKSYTDVALKIIPLLV